MKGSHAFLCLTVCFATVVHADDFSFLEDEDIQKEMNSVGKKLENITEAKSNGVKADLSNKDCQNIVKHERSYMQKDIYRFVTGTPITSTDLDGDFIQGAVGEERGRWAKMGLGEATTFRAGAINQKWAVHADPRCGPYFKVNKVDYSQHH